MATVFAAPGNNVSTTVGSTYTAGDYVSTGMVLAAGAHTKFPSLSGGQYYRVTVCQVAFAYSPTQSTANYTIYKATGFDGTNLDKLVGMSLLEGTSDRGYAVGDVVEMRTTAGTISDIQTAVNNLEYLSNTVSVTGTTALTSTAFGTTQVCSGTSANYTVTLPAPVVGGIISFRMVPGLTKLVTISQHDTSGHTDKIDGANTRVMWANEVATLVSDGTNWTKVSGRSVPMMCQRYVQSSQGALTIINGGSGSIIPTTGNTSDNTGGLMYSSSNGGAIGILRTSNYDAFLTLITVPTGSSQSGILQAKMLANGSTSNVVLGGSSFYIGVSTGYPGAFVNAIVPGNAGDYWQLGSYQTGLNGSSSTTTDAVDFGQTINGITVVEIPTW